MLLCVKVCHERRKSQIRFCCVDILDVFLIGCSIWLNRLGLLATGVVIWNDVISLCLSGPISLVDILCVCVCVGSCHIRYAQTRWRPFLFLSLWSIRVDGQYRLCQRPFIFLLRNRERERAHIYSRWSERRNDRPYLITFYWLVTAAPVSRPGGRNLFRIRLPMSLFLFFFVGFFLIF